MADPQGPAADEPGGIDGIASDDAGGGALGSHVGQTAGGQESFGAGSEGAADQPVVQGAPEIAADDAGATRAVAEFQELTEHRRD